MCLVPASKYYQPLPRPPGVRGRAPSHCPSPVQAHSCTCPRASRFERCEVKHNPNPTPIHPPFGSVFLLPLYFGWCRPGRHCSVVVGDIALELCTGQKEPKIATSVVPGSGRSPVSLPPYTPHRNLWCGAKPRLIAALYPQPQSGFGAKPRLIAALELCTKKEKKKKKPV